METLFVVGTFWFWALIVAEIIVLFAFVEFDNGIGATISILLGLACLQWMGNVDLIGYVAHHPFNVLGVAAVYFALGTCWGIYKWRIYVHSRLEKYDELKDEFYRSKNIPASTKVVPAQYRAEWVTKLEKTRDYKTGLRLDDTPLVRKHKARITNWMTFWVFSMVWYFINDLVKGIFKAIYMKIAKFLQRIADNIWAGSTIRQDTLVVEGDLRGGGDDPHNTLG